MTAQQAIPKIWKSTRNSFPAGARSAQPGGRIMLVVTAVLFVLALALFTRGNTFPYYYHPDEPLELELVLKGETNFHHPLLMGNVTDGVSRLFHVARTPQQMVLAGRWCVAVFAAIAVVAFAWLAFHYGGLVGGIATGLLLLANPLLVETAHYYKEDPALLMGMALSFLALARFREVPSWKTSVLMGAASALAFSGKYVGIMAALFSIALIMQVPLIAGSTPRLRLFGWFAISFVGLAVLINYQILAGWSVFDSGLGREVVFLGEGGNEGVGRSIPNGKYFTMMMAGADWFIWLLIGWLLVRMFRRRAGVTMPEWIIAGFPFAWLIILSFTSKTAERYFLPAAAVICFLAALGLADLIAYLAARGVARWKIAIFAALGIVAAGGKPAAHTARLLRGFASDDRRELAAWITAHVATGEVIAEDSRVELAASEEKDRTDRSNGLNQIVLSRPFVADLGSLDSLRAQGVKYIAVQANDLFHADRRPSAAVRNDYDRRKAFYAELARRGEIVWQADSRRPLILHPQITLYRLP